MTSRPDLLHLVERAVEGRLVEGEAELLRKGVDELQNRAERIHTLSEQWAADGPPPLGVSISRWWDKRLIELNKAIEGKS